MGSGKTTLAVALADYYHETRDLQILSNMTLKSIDYTPFTLEYLAEQMKEEESSLEDCVLLLDETYQIADSRNSASKFNRLFSYFVVQTRKRNVELICCTHSFRSLDLRLRSATDEKGTAHYKEENPCRLCKGTGEHKEVTCPRCNGYGKTGRAWCKLYSQSKWTSLLFEVKNTSLVWPLFDTRERVPMRGDTFDKLGTVEVG